MPPIKTDSEEVQRLPQAEADSSATFGNCDLALFKSGRHADTIIECNGQQFPVHKAILDGRCGWFRKNIREIGEQSGAVLPIIKVTSYPPIDIEAILSFIYSGDVDPDLFPDNHQAAYVRFYNLGHVFDVANLCDTATTRLGNFLSDALKHICDRRLWVPAHNSTVYHRTEIQDRLRKTNFMSNYLAAVERADDVRRAGSTEMERLRPFQMLVDFFLAGEDALLAEPEFELWLESDVVPSFAKAVLLTRKKGGCRSKWMKALVAKPPLEGGGRQGLCVDCHTGLKNIKECGGAAFANPRSWKGSYTQVMCKRCAEKERNLGEDGFPRWDVFSRRKEE